MAQKDIALVPFPARIGSPVPQRRRARGARRAAASLQNSARNATKPHIAFESVHHTLIETTSPTDRQVTRGFDLARSISAEAARLPWARPVHARSRQLPIVRGCAERSFNRYGRSQNGFVDAGIWREE